MKGERIVWSMHHGALVISDFLVVRESEIFWEKSQSSLLGCLRHLVNIQQLYQRIWINHFNLNSSLCF